MGECVVCQACQRNSSRHGRIEFTPIPPSIMFSVALDVFQLNKVSFQGKEFDCMVVCFDRHSGCIIALPFLYRGLTGAKVAHAMVEKWRWFGISSLVTSDQGSPFISAWWKTMCAR